MKLFKIVTVFAFILFFEQNVQAQDATLQNNKRRIENGIKSGELTKNEARELRENQQEIREEKHEAKADGVVTRGERREINEEKREQNKEIYRKKHNHKRRQ